MAIGLKVLMNVKSELDELFDEKDIALLKTKEGAERYKMTLRKIYNNAVEEIKSTADMDGELHGSIGYFKNQPIAFEEAQSEKGYGFGATKPYEIREAILSWNCRQSMNLLNLLDAFEAQAEKCGFTGMRGLFSSVLTEDGRIQTERFMYPASICELRKAFDAVDNVFTYGQGMFFYDDSVGVSTCLPVEVTERAKEHPEDFLILEVYYN